MTMLDIALLVLTLTLISIIGSIAAHVLLERAEMRGWQAGWDAATSTGDWDHVLPTKETSDEW